MFRRSVVFLLAASPALAQSGERAPSGPPRREPPFDQIAQDLGIPAERVRNAFRKVGPPARGEQPPTEEQLRSHAQALATAMAVPVDKLLQVLEKHRPGPPPSRNTGADGGPRSKS